MLLLNLHRRDSRNAGDMMSSPLSYFEFGCESRRADLCDVADDEVRSADAVVVGGGGLLGNSFFRSSLRRVTRLRRGFLCTWGVGTNRHSMRQKRYSTTDRGPAVGAPSLNSLYQATVGSRIDRRIAARFDSHGVRDPAPGDRWVPCPSCMHPALDVLRDTRPRHHLVVLEHPDFCRLSVRGVPTQPNTQTPLPDILDFLASGETVVTSSYHGAYWATLLGRRVVVVSWSTKFRNFPYPAPVLKGLKDLDGAIDRAAAFPHALGECREASQQYARLIAERLGVPVRPTAESAAAGPLASPAGAGTPAGAACVSGVARLSRRAAGGAAAARPQSTSNGRPEP